MTRMWFLYASLQSFPKSVHAGSTGRIDLSFRFYTRRISRNMEDIARHPHSGRRSGLLLLLQTSTGFWSSLKILSSSVLNKKIIVIYYLVKKTAWTFNRRWIISVVSIKLILSTPEIYTKKLNYCLKLC